MISWDIIWLNKRKVWIWKEDYSDEKACEKLVGQIRTWLIRVEYSCQDNWFSSHIKICEMVSIIIFISCSCVFAFMNLLCYALLCMWGEWNLTQPYFIHFIAKGDSSMLLPLSLFALVWQESRYSYILDVKDMKIFICKASII